MLRAKQQSAIIDKGKMLLTKKDALEEYPEPSCQHLECFYRPNKIQQFCSNQQKMC